MVKGKREQEIEKKLANESWEAADPVLLPPNPVARLFLPRRKVQIVFWIKEMALEKILKQIFPH